MATGKTGWLLFPEGGGEAETPPIRLFCLAHAGGGAAAYRLWGKGLAGVAEVVRIQIPGRESRFREPLISDPERLVAELAENLAPALDRPWAFFGHSMGALVGFEACRELASRGLRSPEHFFAAGFRAPHIGIEDPIHPIEGDLPFLDALDARYGGVPAALRDHPDLLAAMLPIVRADLTVCESYRYPDRGPLDCGITAMGGRDDRWVGEERLAAWERYAARGFELRWFDGGHFFVESSRDAVLATVAERCASLAPAGS